MRLVTAQIIKLIKRLHVLYVPSERGFEHARSAVERCGHQTLAVPLYKQSLRKAKRSLKHKL